MKYNDQLTRGERIRLEALSQSMGATSLSNEQRPTISKILENAKIIEAFIKEAPEDGKGAN